MKKECAKFPESKHTDCELNPDEKIMADYFESRGLIVERLCVGKPKKIEKEGTPDFRIVGKNLVCICEVKRPDSPTGDLSESDWKYVNRLEFEQWKEEAKKQNTNLTVTCEQLELANGKIDYPDNERNTGVLEEEKAKKIKKLLEESTVGNFPLAVTIYRSDPFSWTQEELQGFVNHLIDKLSLIGAGKISPDWNVNGDFHFIYGEYRKARADGRYIHNQIFVRLAEKGLKIEVLPNSDLGVNWESIEGKGVCRKAQKQIKDQLLYRESKPEKVIRLVVIFLEQNLLFEYFSNIDKLESEINRRVLSKFPEFSAVVFCENFDPRFSRPNFLVFHTENNNVPSFPKDIFDDGFSQQFPK
ncbi:MAG: hypothetical protein HOP27_00685 [Anaerolineales bacterium]|nr:hypothetical protein [Anaerolineales bacterium]